MNIYVCVHELMSLHESAQFPPLPPLSPVVIVLLYPLLYRRR